MFEIFELGNQICFGIFELGKVGLVQADTEGRHVNPSIRKNLVWSNGVPVTVRRPSLALCFASFSSHSTNVPSFGQIRTDISRADRTRPVHTLQGPWATLVDQGLPWSNMVDRGRPSSTLVDPGRPWSTMVDHGQPGSTSFDRGQLFPFLSVVLEKFPSNYFRRDISFQRYASRDSRRWISVKGVP